MNFHLGQKVFGLYENAYVYANRIFINYELFSTSVSFYRETPNLP